MPKTRRTLSVGSIKPSVFLFDRIVKDSDTSDSDLDQSINQSINQINRSINQSISQSINQSLLRASEQRAQAAEQSINQLTLELSTKTVMNDTRNKLMDPASIAYLQHCVTSFLATHDESLEPVICQLLNIDKTQVGQLKKDKTQSSSIFSLFKR